MNPEEELEIMIEMNERAKRAARSARLAATLAIAGVIATFAGLVFATVARADAVDNTTILTDSVGARLDAHDGDLLEHDGSVYLYGTSYGCGFELGDPDAPYCGVRVYETQDLRQFEPAGAVGGMYAFDHLGDPVVDWQEVCQERLGCYRPHVVERADGKFVMWVNTHGGTGAYQAGYIVLTSDDPRGPFEPQAARPTLAVDPADGGLEHGDMDLFVDDAGVGWVVYTVIRQNPPADEPSHTLVVERLNSDLDSGAGDYVVVENANDGTAPVEAPALFEGPNGNTYIAFADPARPYGIMPTGLVESFDGPLGPWTWKRELTMDSCSGQPLTVVELGGVWVFAADRWVPGALNQFLSVPYFDKLTFNADWQGGKEIDYQHCHASVDLGLDL